MFKRTALALSLALAAAAAFAGEADDVVASGAAPSGAFRFEVRGDIDTARASGMWPVREYDPVPIYHRPKAKRKEYPNVMGVRFADWLAARQAASDVEESAVH